MLKYTAICDKNVLDSLSKEIFGVVYPKTVGYVLYDENCGEKPIGLAQIDVKPDVSRLEKIGIIPSERGKGNGDFFTRSIIWGLSNVSEKVVVEFVSSYFEKFGFIKEENGMAALSKTIKFPCGCHK